MFTGVTFEKAIEYWRKGKEVIVLDRNSASNRGSGYDTFDFKELFENFDFLVDMPAYRNPEFEAVVQKMGLNDAAKKNESSAEKTEEVSGEESKAFGGAPLNQQKRANMKS